MNTETSQPPAYQSPALALATCSASLALDAYRDLMTGPLPSCDRDYRRAIMLAVLIGRQIEADFHSATSVGGHKGHAGNAPAQSSPNVLDQTDTGVARPVPRTGRDT